MNDTTYKNPELTEQLKNAFRAAGSDPKAYNGQEAAGAWLCDQEIESYLNEYKYALPPWWSNYPWETYIEALKWYIQAKGVFKNDTLALQLLDAFKPNGNLPLQKHTDPMSLAGCFLVMYQYDWQQFVKSAVEGKELDPLDSTLFQAAKDLYYQTIG